MKTNSKKIILKNQLNTAVLFLVFNRPDTTNKVFEKIRQVKPRKLYIAGDGCREGNEDDKEKIKKVREITSNIDWYCEVKTLFRDKNLGCKKGVSSAIDWFFDHEAQGIILEDDCLPSKSFFYFCEYFLDHYFDDKKIWCISGYNYFKKGQKQFYYFSRWPGVWGWASWRDRWLNYDKDPKVQKLNNYHGYGFLFTSFWNRIYRDMHILDTWDYQFAYLVMKNKGYVIRPNLSMIENIGFGPDATHTKEKTYSSKSHEDLPNFIDFIGTKKSTSLEKKFFIKKHYDTKIKIIKECIKYTINLFR